MTPAPKPFTGRHAWMIAICFFGVIIAVNITMASLAIGGFSGLVVENAYVASQQYNGWLEKARAENTLGWSAEISRQKGGKLAVKLSGAPADAKVEAELRHPLGRAEKLRLTLKSMGGGHYKSAAPIPEGRHIVRLRLSSGAEEMHVERPLG